MFDPEKRKEFEKYLRDVSHTDQTRPHSFLRFQLSEIVQHDRFGLGVVSGFRLKDEDRNFFGLGVQFVNEGKMTRHVIFTPKESEKLKGTKIIFDIPRHGDMSLEQILNREEK